MPRPVVGVGVELEAQHTGRGEAHLAVRLRCAEAVEALAAGARGELADTGRVCDAGRALLSESLVHVRVAVDDDVGVVRPQEAPGRADAGVGAVQGVRTPAGPVPKGKD